MDVSQKLEKVKLLGRGAFGEVYHVQNPYKMDFALKKLRLNSQQEVEQALIEAKFLFKLNHPNIVRFQQVFEDGENFCILMEYAEGGSLYDLVLKINKEGKHLEEGQILDYTSQLCQALDYLHKKNIIHRDIKPQNILLDSEGTLKLADLGIARLVENTVGNAQTFAGTKPYMCPEMLYEDPYTVKADMWAVGVVVYQLCTGQLPFKTTKESLKGVYPPLTGRSPAMQEIVSKTLVVEPSERATAKEIIQLIETLPRAKGPALGFSLPQKSPISKLTDDMDTVKLGSSEETEDTTTHPTTINYYHTSSNEMANSETEEMKMPVINKEEKKKIASPKKLSPSKLVPITKSTNGDYQFLYKIVLVGEEKTGKTSIVTSFLKNEFLNKNLPTIGVEFATISIEMKGKVYKLQIWDTAGQQRYKSITSAHYRKSRGALLVFDITNRSTFIALSALVEEVRNGAEENASIVIVGNKSDLDSSRQVDYEEAEEFAQKSKTAGYIETSAKDFSSVTDAFTLLVNAICNSDNRDAYEVKSLNKK